jgi:hypothetical protein
LHYVECPICLLRGPHDGHEKGAIWEWNALPRPTKQEECPERSQEQVEPVVNACPICHDLPDVHVDAWPSGIKSAWVECACGTEGAIGKSKQEAIEYWNMLSSEGDRWISVDDELPKERTFVLAFDGLIYRIAQVGKWSHGSSELTWICSFEGVPISVTHWRPLPNLPKPVKPDSTSEWISVKDRLPKSGLCVMARISVSEPFVIGYLMEDGATWKVQRPFSTPYEAERGCVTHWQSFPGAPADLEEDS